jgi:glycine/D-amino acid oxidase-like deaminating enzyme
MTWKRSASICRMRGLSVARVCNMPAMRRTCRRLRRREGIQVFDHTEIKSILEGKKGVTLITTAGNTIKARKLVIACGYESGKYIPKKVEELHTTYAIVSEPFDVNKFWYRNALIWETAKPYLYLRATSDNRILIGGKDDNFHDARLRDAKLPSRARALETAFRKLLPHLEFRTDFKWAGVFASTRDGLPYIGQIPNRAHSYFALGFGGNGIIFSVIAARLITSMITGKKSKDADIFSFSRK